MATDNRLGAPTEGLGQNVTFTAGAGGQRSQARGMQRNAPRNEQRGGNITDTSGPIQIPETQPNVMLKTLTRMAGDILQPKIEQARTDAFLSGMQRAATGEAVNEIVAEQPWYADLFGDTPVVEGARAFTSFSRVQAEAADIEGNMAELRQLSPAEFQKKMGERMGKLQTGDAATDSMVMQSLMKEMPGLMKGHAKEHIGWQQDNYAKAARTGQLTASNRLKSVMSRFNPSAKPENILNGGEVGAFTDENDLMEAKVNFVQAFGQPPGVPEATHQKMTTGVISDLLVQKNLHAYYTLEDAGVIDSLGPESSKKLRELADRQESRARAEMPLQLVDAFAAIKAMPSLYDTEGINDTLRDRIGELNAAYKASTGARENLISGNSAAEIRASLLSNQINAERRANEAYAKAQDKNLDDRIKKEAEVQANHEGVGIILRGDPMSRVTKEVRLGAWDTLRQDIPSLMKGRAAQFNRSNFDEDGKGTIANLAASALASDSLDSFEQLYQKEYLPMVQAGGEALALSYFGDYAKQFSTYHGIRKNTTDANGFAAAYAIAKNPIKPLATTKGSVDQEVKKVVADATTSTFTSNKLNPRFQDEVTSRLLPYVNAGNPGASVKERTKAALKTAEAEGLEFAGGYYWDARGSARFKDAVNAAGAGEDKVAVDEFDDAIGLGIDNLVATYGMDRNSARVIYTKGQGDGPPTLTVMGDVDDSEGYRWVAYPLTAVDVVEQFKKERAKPTIPLTGGIPALQAGPKLTYLPKEGAKSIYDR
jgi:hypothetical protein